MKRLHYYLLFVLIAGTVIFVLSILLIVKEEVVYTRFFCILESPNLTKILTNFMTAYNLRT